jgi:perosamine synthetase
VSGSIPWAKPRFSDLARAYLAQAIDSTWVSHGPFVERFEAQFNRLVGSPFGFTTSNGTTALYLAFLALGLGPGDEVIVPGFTFVAPGNMAIAVGATPVFADIDPDTWQLDPASVEACITPRTRAIVAVHLYGDVCDMDALQRLARDRGLLLVEDVAEACLSRHRGRYAGTFGDVGCFSFQATKTISMGEGGYVTTADPALHERMRRIRDHGMQPGRRYWHDVVGHNFRLTNLQAALGVAQLEELDGILADRRRVDRVYRARLAGARGVRFQTFRPEVDPIVWAFAIRLDPAVFGERDDVMAALAEAGIETRPGFYPFGALPPYQRYVRGPLPTCEQVAREVISLPTFASLTDDELARVAGALLEVPARAR